MLTAPLMPGNGTFAIWAHSGLTPAPEARIVKLAQRLQSSPQAEPPLKPPALLPLFTIPGQKALAPVMRLCHSRGAF